MGGKAHFKDNHNFKSVLSKKKIYYFENNFQKNVSIRKRISFGHFHGVNKRKSVSMYMSIPPIHFMIVRPFFLRFQT